MSRMRFRWSRAAYRIVLGVYPAEFRARFADDLSTDFGRMLSDHGRATAWRRVIVDLLQSLPSTHVHARAVARQRRLLQYHGETAMSSLLFDLRYALRTLIKTPVFTAVTIATLALGIGANTAIFSLVNAVLLRDLGYGHVDRLLLIYEGSKGAKVDKFPVSVPDLVDLREMQQSFEVMGAYRSRTFELSGSSEPERIPAARIEATVLQTLGVEPLLGRNFSPEEDTPGHDVAILSYGLWQRRFGGQPSIIGSRVLLDRRPHTVVGVMPQSFQFPRRGPRFNNQPAEVYVPIAFTEGERRSRGMMYNNGVVARIRPGATMTQARSELAVLAPRVRARYPSGFPSSFDLQITGFPIRDEVSGQVRRPLLVLLAAVALVLLVACANVANLILSRAASREREIGVRVALGAGRLRLTQMLLIENLALAIAGGAVGLVIATWALRAVPSVIATSLPGVENVGMDVRVLAFTAMACLVTALFFGLAPISSAARMHAASSLREGTPRVAHGRHRTQHTLVVATVALAVMLLAGSGLLLRSFAQLLATDPGFNPDRVLAMTVALPREAYRSADGIRRFYAELTQRASHTSGVERAGAGSDLPMRGDEGERRAFTADRSDLQPTSTALTWVLGEYFQVLGIELTQGRYFLEEEISQARSTVIVNESLAKRAWPGLNPIGQRLQWGARNTVNPWLTVVGVVRDVNDGPPGVAPNLHAYEPYSQMPPGLLETDLIGLGRTINLVVRGSGDPATLLTPLRAQLAQLDRSLAVSRISTMRQQFSDAVAPQRFSTLLLTAFAIGALMLAAIGLYGVLAFGVAQRTREIGVRLALGATRSEVLGLVVRQGMTLVVVGIALGIAGAVATTRFMTTLLYRTQPLDPWTLASVPLVLATVALLACYFPARRAARVEPMVALRTE